MAGMYSIKDLLNLVEQEGAQELQLQAGETPLIVLHGQRRKLDMAPLTSDNVTELFRSLATPEQLQELNLCGDIHFVYVSQNSARFAISAALRGDEVTLNVRNLGR